MPDREQLRRELLAEYPDLGRTTWTWEQMVRAELGIDEHVDRCDACQEALEDEPPDDDSPYFCPVGESLMETAARMALEYSWQPDFPKPDDPRWAELRSQLRPE